MGSVIAMVRVYVCGEGRHDIGVPKENGGATRDEGWLQVILRRLLGEHIRCRAVRRGDLVLQRREQKKYQPLPHGHGAKAMASKLQAKQGGYDLVVFMVDTDSKLKREWRRKRDEVVEGFSRVDGVKDLSCIPMSASESWLLVDDGVWAMLGLQRKAALPRRPETIWGGRRDPGGNHPHHYFRRVCAAARVEDSLDTRLQVAERSDLCKVRNSCPISFGAFVSDLESIRAELK